MYLVLLVGCLINGIVTKKNVNGSPNVKFQENFPRNSEMFHAEREENTNRQT
jgi:hypothetical protein